MEGFPNALEEALLKFRESFEKCSARVADTVGWLFLTVLRKAVGSLCVDVRLQETWEELHWEQEMRAAWEKTRSLSEPVVQVLK